MLKISLLFKKNKILRVNNSRVITIKNTKFSGYYFYMNLNIWVDFQFCISVSLKSCSLYTHRGVNRNRFVMKHPCYYVLRIFPLNTLFWRQTSFDV